MEENRSRQQLVMDDQGKRGLWMRRTSLEKVLLGVTGVALLACMALVAVVAVGPTGAPADTHLSSRAEPGEPLETEDLPMKSMRLPVYEVTKRDGTRYEVCSTQECVLAAAAIIEAMDVSIDPCNDFYQFACGGWIAQNPVPESSSRWAQFDVLRRELSNALSTILSEPRNPLDPKPINEAKDMYDACMNEELLETIGVTPLVDLLSQFGGWPMANGDWTEANFDWEVAVAEARRQFGEGYLVYAWVFADEKDTFSTALYIDQSSLGMPRSVLTTPENYEERIAAYRTYMATTASIIASSQGQDTSQIDTEVADTLDFEMALAQITTPPENRRDIERMYNPMTVAELNTLTEGNINWMQMLSTMFASTDVTVDENTRVIVQELNYLKNLTSLLASTSPRTVANYIMWRHVKDLGDETNLAMRDASFEYEIVANGVSAKEPRWEECSDEANKYMGMALGTKYVESYFSEQAKVEASQMVEDIRAAFIDMLAINEWMDDETKPKAGEKAEAISKFIAYPDWYGNNSALESFYGDLQEISNNTHFSNVQVLNLWQSSEELKQVDQPTQRNRWYSPPTIVNAFYMPEFNSITFPAGILQPPFYRANSLQALNYGGIGQVIGHEITHGFDDQGRQNDKDGNVSPWWSNATLAAFQGRAQCIVDQYGSIRVPELDDYITNATLNGVNTQGENIADNGGLREALLAYFKYVERNGEEPRLPGLEEYTTSQLFFLANANIWCGSITTEGLLNQVLTDPHSPSKYRVNVPMANMQNFSTIWNCPLNSPMNPENKCVVW